MKLALNYSREAADLVRRGQIEIDCFKCPGWPNLIAEARELRPTCVHFAYGLEGGRGDAIDTERKAAPDWDTTRELMSSTETAFVNVHLCPRRTGGDHSAPDVTDPARFEWLAERVLGDLRPVVERFGADRVIAENDNGKSEMLDPLACRPEFIRHIVEASGCGFLFDISHARIAADLLGVDARDYIAALPVERTREIHITGLQTFTVEWADLARKAGVDVGTIKWLEGRLVDHLPMTDPDWEFFAWCLGEVRRGAWGRPAMAAFEYGGVGWFFGAVTKTEALLEQVPRLYAMVHSV